MSIEKIWNTENACNGRCNECRRSKDKAKKALEIYVKGPDKNASSILDVTDAQPDIFNDLV